MITNQHEIQPHEKALHPSYFSSFETLFSKSPNNDFSTDIKYKDAQLATKRWLASLDFSSIKNVDKRESLTKHINQSKSFLNKSPTTLLLHAIKNPNSLEKAFLELFSMARTRIYVLSYLSIQEGLNLDSRNKGASHSQLLISQILNSLGKRTWGAFQLNCKLFTITFKLDPLPHLRSVYFHQLQIKRNKQKNTFRSKLPIQYQLVLFRLKTVVFRTFFRALLKPHLKGMLNGNAAKPINLSFFQRNIAFIILIAFPNAKQLSQDEWTRLLQRIDEWFTPRIKHFFTVVSVESIQNHGISKLLKMAFGTIVWKNSTRSTSIGSINEGDFIFDTLTLAYSWGTTYPLIDNVLDGKSISTNIKSELIDGLKNLFSSQEHFNTNLFSSNHPEVKEVIEQIKHVLSHVPVNQISQTKHILRLLLESHEHDSMRRLSDYPKVLPTDVEAMVWEDSVLKAALIRISTISICGNTIGSSTISQHITNSLINQLGDDLWDIYEDYENDRLTPFTAYLTGLTKKNPFLFFIEYCLFIASQLDDKRSKALIICVQCTIRCALDDISHRKRDPLNVIYELNRVLIDLEFIFSIDQIRSTPHVDPDAVLFGLEDGLLEGILASNKAK